MRCDRCEMLRINGVSTHERGCPNARKVWVEGEWVRFVPCWNCGQDVLEGEVCDCWDDEETPLSEAPCDDSGY